jgi:predicted ArsR family transcriptional regulator
VRWLLANGRGRSPEIAAALGLKEAAVRQQLTRLLRDSAWLDCQKLEMTREGRGLYRLRYIEEAEPAK